MPSKRLFACLALAVGIGSPRLVSATTVARAASASLSRPMLTLINQDRAAVGLAPLRSGRRLEQVALAHSLDMATHSYFSHITPQGATPYDRMAQARIRYQSAGENIGVDSGLPDMQMLHRLETAMLNSPEHRANLLRSSFTRVGIGIALMGNELYITEDFKH